MNVPILTRLLLLRPAVIHARLQRARDAGLVDDVPNLWQLTLGVLRMVERMLTRPETIGLSTSQPVRDTLGARLLRPRPLRFLPALLAGAVRPWDLTGLLTDPAGVIRHLVGAHHDRHQFAYDLQILSTWPGQLEAALAEARRVAASDAARDRFLRDLSVFEGYHAVLVHAIERAIAGDYQLSEAEAADPDVSFVAYLAWCRRQPASPRAWIATRLRRA